MGGSEPDLTVSTAVSAEYPSNATYDAAVSAAMPFSSSFASDPTHTKTALPTSRRYTSPSSRSDCEKCASGSTWREMRLGVASGQSRTTSASLARLPP